MLVKFAQRDYVPEYTNFSLSMIYNEETLNIFSDASMRPRQKGILDTCYGAVAVCKDSMIDEWFRIFSGCTVPAAELRGMRCSLTLAHMYKPQFKYINIFSDSQLALLGLREYIYNWRIDPANATLYNGPKNAPKEVKNQELYVELFQLLESLRQTNIVNLYHQCGHVSNGVDNIKHALITFKKSNNIYAKVGYDLIRYISVYNNYVDNKSRSIIRTTNIYENTFIDPVSFYPQTSLPPQIKIV